MSTKEKPSRVFLCGGEATPQGAEPTADDKCPRCGGELTFGYGLAGGGDPGGYTLCLSDECDYFVKTPDS